jgi:hypothetical protein
VSLEYLCSLCWFLKWLPFRYFEALLFLDEANFAAIPLRDSPTQRYGSYYAHPILTLCRVHASVHLCISVIVKVLCYYIG